MLGPYGLAPCAAKKTADAGALKPHVPVVDGLSVCRPEHDNPKVVWLAAVVLGLGLPALTVFSPTAVEAASGRATSVDALSRRLQEWVAEPDPVANARAVERVAKGVPPGAMVAFLVAVREHPRPVFGPAVGEAMAYRRVAVRGYALAASAALSPRHAAAAVARAADDPDLGIRRLALALAQQYPSPAAHEVIVRLLERDPALAAEQLVPAGLVPNGPSNATPDPFEADIVIQDDDS